MNHRRRFFLAVLSTLVLVAGCSGMSVNSDFDDEYDFTGAMSFAFPPEFGRGTSGVGEVSPLVAKRLMESISRRLEGKGLARVDDPQNADLVVVPHGGKQQKTEVSSTPYAYPYSPWWGDGVNVYQYNEGTLIIDMVDRRSNEMVWRGSATAVVGDQPDYEKLEEAVSKVLERFPPTRTQGGSTRESSGW